MAYFSNGSEGEAFEAANCNSCVHQPTDEDGPGCPVWDAHLFFAYELCNDRESPGKIILDMLITPAVYGPEVYAAPVCKMRCERKK